RAHPHQRGHLRPRVATLDRVASSIVQTAPGASMAGTERSRSVHGLIGMCCRTCARVTEAGVTGLLERAVPISEEKPLNREELADADGFSFVAIGASAGGLAALTRVLSALPADFRAPIAVVQHLDPHYRSLIPQILGRRTRLTVREV